MTAAPGGSLAESPLAARLYDTMVSSRLYNRLAWDTDPAEYAAFAAEAVGSGRGPLLEVAAGPAAITTPLYVASQRLATISDTSSAMLALSRDRAQRLWSPGALVFLDWVQADMWHLPPEREYQTILGLGLLHMIDEPAALLDELMKRLTAGGQLWLSGLVKVNRRASGYLSALHATGEVAAPRTLQEFVRLLPSTVDVTARGAMAYVRVGN